ncbi:MAG: hypothetical protein ACSHYF_16155 [Verrucomicrobiaceae bacterium]
MKNTALAALGGIALGFAAGWFGKPTSTAQAPEESKVVVNTGDNPSSVTQRPDSADSRPSKTAIRDEAHHTADDSMDPEIAEQVDAHQDQFSKMLKKRQRDKFDARIAKLVKELSLTPAQADQLKALWNDDLDFESLMGTGGDDAVKAAEDLAALMNGTALDEPLAAMLSPEQKEAYDALKQREHDNRVESRALKSLSKLSFLDLRDDQKDAVMEILYEQAETAEKKPSSASAMMSLIGDGFGVEMDFDDLGLGDIMAQQMEGNEPEGDPAAIMKAAMDKRIDEKVTALTPVLDQDQLAQYRQHLESKNAGMFGGMLFNSATIEASPETLEAPVERPE